MDAVESQQEEAYLQCLEHMQSLSFEIGMGIAAIECNSADGLAQHVQKQQELCAALASSHLLEGDWTQRLKRVVPAPRAAALVSAIYEAKESILHMSQQYGLLVKQSTKTVNMLLAFYRYHALLSGTQRTQLSCKV
jgi:hypothetical protein